MKIIVISNMYPSTKDPVFGTFVKVFYESLEALNGKDETSLIAIKGRNGIKILKYLCFYLKILYQLLFKNFDLIYVHTITFPILPILLVSKIKKLPLAFNVHGSDLLKRTRLLDWFRKIGENLIYESKFIVSPSKYFVGKILARYPNYDVSNIIISPSGGVDMDLFTPKKRQCVDSRFVIGLVSRIDEGKGWDIFLRAIRILSQKVQYDIKCVIAGNGAEVEKMRGQISLYELDNTVEYVGPVSHKNLPYLYSSFDLFCNCSVLEESLGLVTIEAMACGTPVVGSNIAGIAECIKNGYNGFLFEPSDVENLSKIIEFYILQDDSFKKQLQANCVNFAKQFDTKVVMYNLYNEIYCKCR